MSRHLRKAHGWGKPFWAFWPEEDYDPGDCAPAWLTCLRRWAHIAWAGWS